MRNLALIALFTIITSCKGQNNETSSFVIEEKKDMTEQNKESVPKDAFQMNMGFDDAPVWVWAKFDHFLSIENQVYNHIYGINFWDDKSEKRTMYYEVDREGKNIDSLNFSEFIINPYPGDATLQLISKKTDTLYIFNVLESKEFRRNFKGKDFKRIPTVDLNTNKLKVTSSDVEINIIPKKESFYEVTIIGDEGINKYIFKSNCNLQDDFEMSYYDLTNNRIYLLQKDCYLEKIDI
jgi:hypothetical protein